jgi:hypothetical protein
MTLGVLGLVATVVCVALAAVLCGLALRSIVGRKPRVPSCPRCGYDCSDRLVADGPIVCPECGFRAADARALHARRRRPGRAIGLAVAGLVLLALPWRASIERWARMHLLPRYEVLASGSAAGFDLRIERDRWNDIEVDGMPLGGPDRVVVASPTTGSVLVVPGFHLVVGPGRGAAKQTSLPPDDSPGFGGDIDGDGNPDLVIEVPSGGSGGMTTTYIYEFALGGPVPRSILDNAWFEDEDGDGDFEAVGFESAFAYIWTSGAGSPRPRLALRPDPRNPRRWTIDPERMRAGAPTDAERDAWRTAIESNRGAASREAWMSPMLRWVVAELYAGRPAAAKAVVDAFFVGTAEERATFEREFAARFALSEHAEEIRALATDGAPWP